MNHYEILEVHPKASPEVIKAAYKSLMQHYHPDRNPGDAQAAQRAMLIRQAYEVLSDPERRAAYDAEQQQRSLHTIVARAAGPRASPGKARYEEIEHISSLGQWLLVGVALAVGGTLLGVWLKKEPAPAPAARAQAASASLDDLLPLVDQDTPRPAPRHSPPFGPPFSTPVAGAGPAAAASAPAPGETGPAPTAAPAALHDYILDLGVALRPRDGNPAAVQHALYIPRIGFVVGAFDADRYAEHLKENQAFISARLAEALQSANYTQLRGSGGADYLKTFILDAMGEIDGTDRTREYPGPLGGAPQHYGVVQVLIPEPFSLK